MMQGESGVGQESDHGQGVPGVPEDGPEGRTERAECRRGAWSVGIG